MFLFVHDCFALPSNNWQQRIDYESKELKMFQEQKKRRLEQEQRKRRLEQQQALTHNFLVQYECVSQKEDMIKRDRMQRYRLQKNQEASLQIIVSCFSFLCGDSLEVGIDDSGIDIDRSLYELVDEAERLRDEL